MPPDDAATATTAAEIKSIHEDIRELKANYTKLTEMSVDMKVSMTRQEERQNETSRKIDNLNLILANNYVSAVEHSDTKKRVDKLEGWLTWILRLMVGSVLLAALAALRLKGGI